MLRCNFTTFYYPSIYLISLFFSLTVLLRHFTSNLCIDNISPTFTILLFHSYPYILQHFMSFLYFRFTYPFFPHWLTCCALPLIYTVVLTPPPFPPTDYFLLTSTTRHCIANTSPPFSSPRISFPPSLTFLHIPPWLTLDFLR